MAYCCSHVKYYNKSVVGIKKTHFNSLMSPFQNPFLLFYFFATIKLMDDLLYFANSIALDLMCVCAVLSQASYITSIPFDCRSAQS